MIDRHYFYGALAVTASLFPAVWHGVMLVALPLACLAAIPLIGLLLFQALRASVGPQRTRARRDTGSEGLSA